MEPSRDMCRETLLCLKKIQGIAVPYLLLAAHIGVEFKMTLCVVILGTTITEIEIFVAWAFLNIRIVVWSMIFEEEEEEEETFSLIIKSLNPHPNKNSHF